MASNNHVTLDKKTHSAPPGILVNSFEVADTSTGTNKGKKSGKECQFSQKRYTITDSLSVISDTDCRKKGKGKSKKVAQQKAKTRQEPVTVDFLSTDENNISVVFEPGFRIKSPNRDSLPKRKKTEMAKIKGGTKKPRKPHSKTNISKFKPLKYSQFVDRFSFKKKPTSSLSGLTSTPSAPSVKNVGTNESRGPLHFLQELDSYPIFEDFWNGSNMPPYHLERFDFPSSVNSVNDMHEESSDMSESDTSNTTTTNSSELTVSETLNVPTDESSSRSSEVRASLSSIVPSDEDSELRRSYHSIILSSSSEVRTSLGSIPTDECSELGRSYLSILPSRSSSKVRASLSPIVPTDKGSEVRRSYHSIVPSRRSSKVRVSFSSIVQNVENSELKLSDYSYLPTDESSRITMSDISIRSRRSEQEVRSLFELDTYTYPVIDARLNKSSRAYSLKTFEYPTSPVYYANLLSEEASEMSESETSIAGSHQKPCSIFDLYCYPIIDASLKEYNRPYAPEKISFAHDKGEVSDGPGRSEHGSYSSFSELLSPWRVSKDRMNGSITPCCEDVKFMAFEYSMDYENCAGSRDVSNDDDEDYRPSLTSLGSCSSFSSGLSRESVSRDDISDICTSLSSIWNNLFVR